MTDTDRPRVWGIHASVTPEILTKNSVIAVTWRSQFDLKKALPSGKGREELMRVFMENTGRSKRSASIQYAILAACENVAVGDYVAFHHSEWYSSYVLLGRVTGKRWRYVPESHYEHQRDVKWLKMIGIERFGDRDVLNRIARHKAFAPLDAQTAELILDRARGADRFKAT